MSSVLALALAVPALGGPSNPIASKAVTLTKVNKKAKAAKNAADAAQSTANTALSTANLANTNANQAKTQAAAAQASADAAQASANAANANANTKLSNTTEVFEPQGALNSTDNKTSIANCPAGFEITGGGFITAGAGNNDITPNLSTSYGDNWIAGFQEIGAGTAETWSIGANAVCVN